MLHRYVMLVEVVSLISSAVLPSRGFAVAAPEFSTEQIHESLTLKEGETVILELPYSASPAPRVTWDFNGRPLVASRRVTVDVIRNMTSACIGHVEMADAGTYTVTLENQYGKSTCSIRVKVFGKPRKRCFCSLLHLWFTFQVENTPNAPGH